MMIVCITKTHNKRFMPKRRWKKAANELAWGERWKYDCSMCSISCARQQNVYAAIRRYQRVFCLRFKQYSQNYMHTPRHTNWHCTLLSSCEEFPVAFFIFMAANERILIHITFLCITHTVPYCCLYVCVPHAILDPIFVYVCKQTNMNAMLVCSPISVCMCVCIYQLMAYTWTSISKTADDTKQPSSPHRNFCTA